MARLKRLPPRLAAPPPRIRYLDPPDRTEAARTEAAPWRRWYKTEAWQRLRWQVLVAAAFTCAACGAVESRTSRLVADHIRPHRGDAARFWDRANLQCLCKPCHDGAKQREEARLPRP